MPYLDVATLETYLTGDLLARATADQKTQAVNRVNAELDRALTTAGYTLPIATDPLPADMLGRLADLARYRLAVELQLLPEPADSSATYLDARAAEKWLADIAGGRLDPGLADSSTAGTPGDTASPSIFTNPRRAWEDL